MNPDLFKRDSIKLSTLVNRGGAYLRRIFIADAKHLTFEKAVEKIDEYFRKNSCKVADEAKFVALKQEDNETFENFSEKVKKAAVVLGVKDEQRIMAKVIEGAKHKTLLDDFSLRPGTTLDDVITLGNVKEARLKTLSNDLIEREVNVMDEAKFKRRFEPYRKSLGNMRVDGNNRAEKRNFSGRYVSCYNCGQEHPPRKCPAFGKACDYCSRPNHFALVCRKKAMDERKVKAETKVKD